MSVSMESENNFFLISAIHFDRYEDISAILSCRDSSCCCMKTRDEIWTEAPMQSSFLLFSTEYESFFILCIWEPSLAKKVMWNWHNCKEFQGWAHREEFKKLYELSIGNIQNHTSHWNFMTRVWISVLEPMLFWPQLKLSSWCKLPL